MVQFNLKSNSIDFKPWSQLIPLLAKFELGGKATLEADAKGPSTKLGYHAKLVATDLTAKAEKPLKTAPHLDLLVDVITDEVDQLTLSLKAPGNDFQIHGKVHSFTEPKIDVDVSSSGMDLDQLIEMPAPAPAASLSKSGQTPSSQSDKDQLLAPIRENKVLAGLGVAANLKMAFIKFQEVKVSDLEGKLSFHDLSGGVESFSMKVFGGQVSSRLVTDLKPKVPTYQVGAQVTGLDLKQAVESKLKLFKDTLLGRLSFAFNGDGSSFNADQAMANLKAKGRMKVENASFATLDISKMATDAINHSIDRVAEKVPQAKGKSVGSPSGKESRYKIISSDFEIKNGKFSAPNFVAQAETNAGVDLKGSLDVGLKDQSLKAAWTMIDSYNFLKSRDISVNVAGTQVDHLLAEGADPVKFPIHIEGTIAEPKYSYSEVPEYLAGVAAGNVARAGKEKASSAVKQKAQSVIEKAPVPDLLKKKLPF
jgi:hypothetical protein